MEQFKACIDSILKGVCVSGVHKKELQDELLDHLLMLRSECIEEGMTEEEAENEAVRRFGDIDDINRRYKGVFTPYTKFKEITTGKGVLKEAVQWTFSIVGAVVLALSLRSYVFAATEVRQCSMQDTLYEGQRLVESRVEYYYSEPKRGDIVIINQEAEKGAVNTFIATTQELVDKVTKGEDTDRKRLIKRVVGVPGDTIDIKEGKVYIDGKVYNEPYVKGKTLPLGMKFPFTIPENEYFVLGDNREHSTDSRDIGLISKDKIEGKALLRLWPLDKVGGI